MRYEPAVVILRGAKRSRRIHGRRYAVMAKAAYVYILASKKHGTLYTGVTSNLERRIHEHKHRLIDGFTHKYNVTYLVWFEQGEDIVAATELEKKIKNRGRKWKIALIEKNNPGWIDLAANWMDSATTGAIAPSAQNDRGNA